VLSIYSKLIALFVASSKSITRAISKDVITITENYILDEVGNEAKSFPEYFCALEEEYISGKIKTEYNISPGVVSDMISEMISVMFRFKLLKLEDMVTDDMMPDVVYQVDDKFLTGYGYGEYQNDKYLHSACKAMIRNHLLNTKPTDGGDKGGN
jgi:hypothetical protein